MRDVCAKIAGYVKKFVEVVDVSCCCRFRSCACCVALGWNTVSVAGKYYLLPGAEWGTQIFFHQPQLSLNNFESFDAMVEGLEIVTNIIVQCGIIETVYLPKDPKEYQRHNRHLDRIF